MSIAIHQEKSTTSQEPLDHAPLVWRSYTSSQLEEALVLWRELERRLDSATVTNSATWTASWIRAYGDLIPYKILVAESSGVIRGICLVTEGVGQKDGPLTVRTRHIGTAGEPQPGSACVEYNRILAEPKFYTQFVNDLSDSLNSDSGWEQLRFDGFEERDLQDWKKIYPNAEVRIRESRYFDLSFARLSETDVLTQLGRSTRSNLKRRLKQYGELTCHWASSVEQADEILNELIVLHQARWNAIGEPGAFANERFHNFQREVGLNLFLEGKAVLFRVQQQSETIGCLLLLNDGNRLLDYLSGFASFEKKPSPGLISHYLCMEEALRRGFNAYDFLVGEKRHKENLSTHSNHLCWMTESRATWKRALMNSCRGAKRFLQRWRVSPPDRSDLEENPSSR
ncbi:MAG TPA: GNAT family N-acetyltransferase [Planctomicrobium sp.]|nr:GNAT family N-acetyltransferase [Planctomicrobium sp.]